MQSEKVVSYSMGSVFADGVETLRRYTQENTEIPANKPSRKALGKLLEFLDTSLTTPFSLDDQKELECHLAVQLAQHLFSKLAVGCKFTIDDHYCKDQLKNDGEYVCPCGQSDILEGDFGDTSFGCPDAWHGSVDIFLENLPVTVTTQDDDSSCTQEGHQSDEWDCGNESTVKVTTGQEFSTKCLSQMLAQTIVFSFLQRKQSKYSMENHLVPSIGVNTSSIIVHLYDCENDILLQSSPLNLFIGNTLNFKTAVILWLTLNYRYYCSGVTEDMLKFKAEFCDRVGDCLNKYKDSVVKPVKKTFQKDKALLNWADDFGIFSTNEVRLKFVPL